MIPSARPLLLAGSVALLLHCAGAMAALPEYGQIELQARSNLIVNDNGWNVPAGTSFNSISAAINDEQQVAFTAGIVPIDGDLSNTGAGLWVGGHAAGDFVAIHDPGTDPKATMIISDRPSINADGQVAYYTSLDGGTYVLRKYDPLSGGSDVVPLLPLSPSSLANPRLADDGTIGVRGGFSGAYAFVRLVPAAAAELIAFDSNYDGSSPYAYLYSPDTNNAHQIASKVSTSDYNHNEIRLFDGLGDSRLLVADTATDATSPFSRFDNGLGLNDHGAVALAVGLAEGNVRALYRFTPVGDTVEAVEIARVDPAGPIRAIDAFAPDINNDGLVVFRGQDANGQAVFVGDGKTLVRVIGKGDVVSTDQGPGQIGQHIDDPGSWPIFSGAPTINNAGDIALVAALHPEGDSGTEWGSGVFVAYAETGVDNDLIFADGFETVPSIEYAYDDGDGDTNQGPPSTFDPDMLWGNYYLAQPGGEVITRISVAFGPTFPSLENGPVTFWLLQDADADFDPRNAHAVAQVQATPSTFNDNFHTVSIPPTLVSGGFFVGASAKLMGGEDNPARVDTSDPGDKSWYFYAPDIAAVIDDLASAPYSARNDANPIYPGAFMVRATGIEAP